MSVESELCMEKLLLRIVEHNLDELPESNLSGVPIPPIDDAVFEKSLEHGCTIVIALGAYLESFINSIIRDNLECQEDFFLKDNLIDKIQMLYFIKGKDFAGLKADSSYANFKLNIGVRNEIIHYKHTVIAEDFHTGFKLGKVTLEEFFTKSKMSIHVSKIQAFVQKICDDLELVINTEKPIISKQAFSRSLGLYVLPSDCPSDELPEDVFRKLFPDREYNI